MMVSGIVLTSLAVIAGVNAGFLVASDEHCYDTRPAVGW
jgi:hypothetical protein